MNDAGNKKIPILSLIFIYFSAIYTPASRYIARNTAATAHQASWLVPLCSLVVFAPLLWSLYRLSKTFEGQSYHDILCRILGRGAGIALSAAYLVWMLILLSLYLIYSSEQIVTAAYVDSDIYLFVFMFVLIVAIFLRWGLRVLARMNAVIVVAGFVQFLIITFMLMPKVSILNLTPISRLDVAPILASCPYDIAIVCYITFLFIFNDQIGHGRNEAGKFAFAAVFVTLAITQGIIVTLGVFGYELSSQLNFPLLVAVQNITILNKSAGLDSLFLSAWLVQEYVTIALFSYGACRLIKNMFRLKNDVPVLTAVMGLAFFFAAFFSNDVFELSEFSVHVATPVNLMLGVAVPFLLFLTGKIRKLI